MKDIELAKRWRHQVSETVVHEYPAGSKATVSDHAAKVAFEAGVLKGEPVNAAPPADEPPAKTKTKP